MNSIDLDSAESTHLHRKRILEKRFLHKIYEEWYEMIKIELNPINGMMLELGSGGGFIKEIVPKVITSDLIFLPWIDMVLDGLHLPFADNVLDGIFMVNVFHHLPQPEHLLSEAGRCIKPNGVVLMIEPWVSSWSRFVYKNFHHEPFDTQINDWNSNSGGRLSGANGALPWIIFERDKEKFANIFPNWRIAAIQPIMPVRYILSGGLSTELSMPPQLFNFWKWFESNLERLREDLCMFAFIKLIQDSSKISVP